MLELKFNLQFNLKLEVKRQKWESHQGSISTFNLQFNLKLEVKRVRHLQGYLSQLPRLSSSLTLTWSLNVFDYFSPPGLLSHFHV